MKYIGLMFVLIGAAVFSLPHWLPMVAEVRVTDETFTRAGQVGGAVIGLGIVLVLVGLFRRR